MMLPLRLITRIGLFSALFYVLSLAFAAVLNVNPGFLCSFFSRIPLGTHARFTCRRYRHGGVDNL